MNRATEPGAPGPRYPGYRHRPPGYRHRPGPPTPSAGLPVGATPAPDHRPTVRAAAVPGPAPAGGAAGGAAARRWRSRLVALARVLAGGLVVLALVVVVAPLVLGGPGPGGAVVLGHVVAGAVAVAATAVAAHPRSPTPVALAAGVAVPVTLLVLLWSSWWA